MEDGGRACSNPSFSVKKELRKQFFFSGFQPFLSFAHTLAANGNSENVFFHWPAIFIQPFLMNKSQLAADSFAYAFWKHFSHDELQPIIFRLTRLAENPFAEFPVAANHPNIDIFGCNFWNEHGPSYDTLSDRKFSI